MPSKNFPGPNINRIIDQDPQIVKVPMDYMGWGARASGMPKPGDPKGQNPSAPSAPEMTLNHVQSKG